MARGGLETLGITTPAGSNSLRALAGGFNLSSADLSVFGVAGVTVAGVTAAGVTAAGVTAVVGISLPRVKVEGHVTKIEHYCNRHLGACFLGH